MNDTEKRRIFEERDTFRTRLCQSTEHTPEAAMYVATCLLMQAQNIHRTIGGDALDAAILRAYADDSARKANVK